MAGVNPPIRPRVRKWWRNLMDVKQAVQMAKEYVQSLFAGENIQYLGLEEVEGGDPYWEVTVGFSRPWDHDQGLQSMFGQQPKRRSYKVVRIDNETGSVLSVKNHPVTEYS